MFHHTPRTIFSVPGVLGEEVKHVLGPIACEGTDTYMELACKVADLLNQGVDPDMLRRQLANVPDNVLAEQLFEQEAAA